MLSKTKALGINDPWYKRSTRSYLPFITLLIELRSPELAFWYFFHKMYVCGGGGGAGIVRAQVVYMEVIISGVWTNGPGFSKELSFKKFLTKGLS